MTLITRRDLLIQSGLTLVAAGSRAFARTPGGAEKVVPFLDRPAPIPKEVLARIGGDPRLLDWQGLDAWITPRDRFFRLSHFGWPAIDKTTWRLAIDGEVQAPRTYPLAELRAMPRNEVTFALECSGNSGLPFLEGAVGNARWAGASLAEVLKRAGIRETAAEVVFYGADEGPDTLPYISGSGSKLADVPTRQRFARSMTVKEAMDPANLLCYEMNGAPLAPAHGFPVRLIAPGWYGVANVKWLEHIEVTSSRFMGPFMALRYVTLRERRLADGKTAWSRTAVGRARLKSIAAKVTVRGGQHRIHGAAWGGQVVRVEVRIDEEPGRVATLTTGLEHPFAWKFWVLDWTNARPGEHRIRSRAIDRDGNVQPDGADPTALVPRTYWEHNEQIVRTIRI